VVVSLLALLISWAISRGVAYFVPTCLGWPSLSKGLQIVSALIFLIAATGFAQEEIATWKRETLPERASGWLLYGMFALGTLRVLISLNL
jgi:hypothetical protein